MFLNMHLIKNKYLELVLFKKGWPTLIDLGFSLTTKHHERDHWGLRTHLIILGYVIIELNIYDHRHQEHLEKGDYDAQGD